MTTWPYNAQPFLVTYGVSSALSRRFADYAAKWIDRLLQLCFATVPTINKPATGSRFSAPILRLTFAIPEPLFSGPLVDVAKLTRFETTWEISHERIANTWCASRSIIS
jgi:hypothetical protein